MHVEIEEHGASRHARIRPFEGGVINIDVTQDSWRSPFGLVWRASQISAPSIVGTSDDARGFLSALQRAAEIAEKWDAIEPENKPTEA
jgi:hypothetical protein